MLARALYLLWVTAFSASAATISLRGVGGGVGTFPVSQNTLAFWLLQTDRTPLVMVYCHGPTQWYDTECEIDSQFTNTAVGGAELKCAKATLHIRVDRGAGRTEIQHKSFSLAANNTFLVLHTADAQQKIIPLGHHDLPKTAGKPAAVRLLDADKALKKRIQNEAGSI